MSSNNRITDTATIAGPPPSTNGSRRAPSPNGSAPLSPGSQNRGGPHPTPPPSSTSPDSRPSTNGSRDAGDTSPSTNRSGQPAPSANGRDDVGRFSHGNPGGPGNPFARYVADLRKAAIEAIGREGLKAIFIKMEELALQGSVAAAKFCASYMIGKPAKATDPDRLNVNEWNLMKEEAPMMKEMTQLWKTPAPALPLQCLRESRHATAVTQSGMMAAMFAMPPMEQDRLFELGAANPHEVCNLLRDKAKNLGQSPSSNGKGKKRRR